MLGPSISLFRLMGFEVKLDLSWIFLAILVTWTLATGYFPSQYPGLAADTYWSMGIVGSAGLFISIVLHELSHSLVARQYGMPIGGITLFIFGGVAELEREPPTAKSEFLMAIAGPIASFILAGVFYVLAGAVQGISIALTGVLAYLALINLVLAVFNLVPAFPLDGGRALRAALWGWKGSMEWATRIASSIGFTFGLFLIIMGVMNFFGGNTIGGLWWGLIGLFITQASRGSYAQMQVHNALEGAVVADRMTVDPITVAPELTLEELVDGYFHTSAHRAYPVVHNGHVLGLVDSKSLKLVPREHWRDKRVREIMHPVGPNNTVTPGLPLEKALMQMTRGGHSRLLVVDGDSHQPRLRGIIVLRDVMRLLELKSDLQELGQ